MKKYSLIMLALMLAIMLTGCGKVEKSTAVGLSVEQTIIGVENENGSIMPVDNAEFNPTESFSVVLLNVSGFKKGDDGMNQFDIDMEILSPEGKILFEQKGILGPGGKLDLPNNVAESPVVYFTIGSDYIPGNYQIKVSIYDKIGSGKASVTKNFTVL